MATTFKALVYADNKRADGTYNIKIRITHNRKSLKISTNYYVEAKDLTRTLKIKDQYYIEETNDLIRKWRKIVSRLGMAADQMDVREIVNFIRQNDTDRKFSLDFIEYGKQVAEDKSAGSRSNYLTALNALCRFKENRPLDISEITAQFLHDFEKHLTNEPVMKYSPKDKGVKESKAGAKTGRAVSLYMECVRSIHNQAKQDYNDEDKGIINIPQSPFKNYKLKIIVKKQKRSVDVETIQNIIDLENETIRRGRQGEIVRRDLARDCFILSFGLVGMNARDLYNCKSQSLKGGIIKYNRSKTKDRRTDNAEMQVRVEPEIKPLVGKYLDPSNERLFIFHKIYSSPQIFNDSLKFGMDRIEKAIKPDRHITFYSARHSWATIARSKALDIDKYTVHEALNHVDPEMKVTDLYIDRDWENIWDANRKVLALFDWEAGKSSLAE